MTWQDVMRDDLVYPQAGSQGARELAAARDTEATLKFWRRHDDFARRGADTAPARCVEQQTFAESGRFKDGKDLVFSEQFGKEACFVINSLLVGTSGKPW